MTKGSSMGSDNVNSQILDYKEFSESDEGLKSSNIIEDMYSTQLERKFSPNIDSISNTLYMNLQYFGSSLINIIRTKQQQQIAKNLLGPIVVKVKYKNPITNEREERQQYTLMEKQPYNTNHLRILAKRIWISFDKNSTKSSKAIMKELQINIVDITSFEK